MQFTVCELDTPPIKSLIEQHYIPWYCDVDSSTEWYTYADNLGSFTLPLISVIDPADSETYLDRTTGVQGEAVFYARLQAHVPPEVTEFQFQLVKSGNGAGTVLSTVEEIQCGLSCDQVSVSLPASTTVRLTAVPAEGSVFNGWVGGDCSGAASCEVTMDRDITVSADFSEKQEQKKMSVLIPLIQGLLQAEQ